MNAVYATYIKVLFFLAIYTIVLFRILSYSVLPYINKETVVTYSCRPTVIQNKNRTTNNVQNGYKKKALEPIFQKALRKKRKVTPTHPPFKILNNKLDFFQKVLSKKVKAVQASTTHSPIKVSDIQDEKKQRFFKLKEGVPYLILTFTPFFGSSQWPYFKPSKCKFNTSFIQITHEKMDFSKSNLVFFHSQNMPSISMLQNLHRNRNKDQLWVYFTAESIINNPPVDDKGEFFQIIATYGASSDIFMPYRFHDKIIARKRNAIKKNYFVSKTNEVAWLVSNCNGFHRNELARKLMLYGVKIEMEGQCSHFFPNQIFRSHPLDLKTFKFYFSAENSLCDGYVTEKYWENPFDYDMIPIVLGGSNYSNPMIAIPGSFIDAMSFDSPKALAEHILDVSSNATKYNSYFEWKNSWKLDTDNYYCSLCRSLLKGFELRKDALATTMDIQKCSKPTQFFYSWINKAS